MTLKMIQGLISTQSNMLKPSKVVVRFSSDRIGETLSLSDENDTYMITVPFEEIERIIKKERSN